MAASVEQLESNLRCKLFTTKKKPAMQSPVSMFALFLNFIKNVSAQQSPLPGVPPLTISCSAVTKEVCSEWPALELDHKRFSSIGLGGFFVFLVFFNASLETLV